MPFPSLDMYNVIFFSKSTVNNRTTSYEFISSSLISNNLLNLPLQRLVVESSIEVADGKCSL